MSAPLTGRFISLDGVDGTGKSTQCRLLADRLRQQGRAVIACADPGSTEIGKRLREILLDHRSRMEPHTEAMLFMASRAELVAQVIRPALESGTDVVSDRYLTANLAYQAYAGGLDVEGLRQVGMFSAQGVLPDRTVILDLDIDSAVQRRGRSADRMESRGRDYLSAVRDGFLAEARRDPSRYVVVSAQGNPDEVHQAVWSAVRTCWEWGEGRG